MTDERLFSGQYIPGDAISTGPDEASVEQTGDVKFEVEAELEEVAKQQEAKPSVPI
jgi:hypothetical protein